MDKPFSLDDSESLQNNRHKIKKYLETFLPKLNDRVHFGFGTSTVDNYLATSKPWYDKKKKESLQESLLTTIKNYTSIYDPELINEASKKKVLMDKVGLSEENADFLDKSCGSLAVWMANKIIEYQINAMKSWVGFKDEEVTKEKALEKINSADMRNWYGSGVTEIMDWVRIGLNGNVSEYKNLSLMELVEESKITFPWTPLIYGLKSISSKIR